MRDGAAFHFISTFTFLHLAGNWWYCCFSLFYIIDKFCCSWWPMLSLRLWTRGRPTARASFPSATRTEYLSLWVCQLFITLIFIRSYLLFLPVLSWPLIYKHILCWHSLLQANKRGSNYLFIIQYYYHFCYYYLLSIFKSGQQRRKYCKQPWDNNWRLKCRRDQCWN